MALTEEQKIQINVLKYEMDIVKSNIDGYRCAIQECKDQLRLLQLRIQDIKNT